MKIQDKHIHYIFSRIESILMILLQAKNQGLKQQKFADHAQNLIGTGRRVISFVLVPLYGTNGMKWNSSSASPVRLSSSSRSNVWAGHIHAHIFQIQEEIKSFFYHKHHSINTFKDNVHVKVLQTYALLHQLVVETINDSIITQKKWLNEALATWKLHRNHIDPIEQSTDDPVLELLLKIAHADLEIPSTSTSRAKLQSCGAFLRVDHSRLWELTTPNPQRNHSLLYSNLVYILYWVSQLVVHMSSINPALAANWPQPTGPRAGA